MVDALDVVASGETFDRNTKVDGWDQTNLTLGLQYWFYKKCRVQLQYTRCFCGENISSKVSPLATTSRASTTGMQKVA